LLLAEDLVALVVALLVGTATLTGLEWMLQEAAKRQEGQVALLDSAVKAESYGGEVVAESYGGEEVAVDTTGEVQGLKVVVEGALGRCPMPQLLQMRRAFSIA
jgi:hypothetical protein